MHPDVVESDELLLPCIIAFTPAVSVTVMLNSLLSKKTDLVNVPSNVQSY